MGNDASVCIANITVGKELEKMLKDVKEIIFRPRFLDDLFLIVNDTDILDFDKWLSELFVHPQFEFTFNYNNQCISFLDMNVMINNNIISTSIFKKQMSKHQMLHFESNHPKHLIKSLPFSQGIRIIRICSNNDDKNTEMNIVMNKFRARNYPENLILNYMAKFNNIDPNSILRPKSQLLIANLLMHNPHILTLYEFNLGWTTPTWVVALSAGF